MNSKDRNWRKVDGLQRGVLSDEKYDVDQIHAGHMSVNRLPKAMNRQHHLKMAAKYTKPSRKSTEIVGDLDSAFQNVYDL